MDSRASLVDLIFTKCSLVYGREFLSRWEGLDMEGVKADWAHELGALLDSPQRIRHALMHLPAERAPTVLQFRQLCIGSPDHYTPKLPPPKATPEQREKVSALLRDTRQKLKGVA